MSAQLWIVLCSPDDATGRWVVRRLRERWRCPAQWISPADVVRAQRWTLVEDADGTHVEFVLSDGRLYRSEDVAGTYCRWDPATADPRFTPAEAHAFHLAWLPAFGQRVFNSPHPHGLAGAERSTCEWLRMADAAGLDIPSYRLRGTTHAPGPLEALLPAQVSTDPPVDVFVIGDTLVPGAGCPPLDDGLMRGLLRLRDLAECPILGARIARVHDGSWLFLGGTPRPQLVQGGDPAIDALARLLGVPEPAASEVPA